MYIIESYSGWLAYKPILRVITEAVWCWPYDRSKYLDEAICAQQNSWVMLEQITYQEMNDSARISTSRPLMLQILGLRNIPSP